MAGTSNGKPIDRANRLKILQNTSLSTKSWATRILRLSKLCRNWKILSDWALSSKVLGVALHKFPLVHVLTRHLESGWSCNPRLFWAHWKKRMSWWHDNSYWCDDSRPRWDQIAGKHFPSRDPVQREAASTSELLSLRERRSTRTLHFSQG